MAESCASERLLPAPALAAVGLTLGRPGMAEAVLEDVDLEVAPGECVLIQGPTGVGKSTLLRALCGLRGVERRAGTVRRAARAALLGQHVETQLLCATVDDEVALGLRGLGLDDAAVAGRVARALARAGLAGCGDRAVDALSAGQKQRVVLAALLAREPHLLLLDEPCSALDAGARRALAEGLAERKRRGAAVVIAEHAPGALADVVDRWLTVDQRRLVHGAAPAAPAFACERLGRAERGRAESAPPAPADLRAWENVRPLPDPRPGERLLLFGPNGAGKSTWLRTLAVRAEATRKRGARAAARPPGDVALVLQEPRRSLFARTAGDEIAFGLQRRGWTGRAVGARVAELLARFDLCDAADRSPLRLSFGQQHRLAVAAALAPRPTLVLLDEPFAGLDPGARDSLLAFLAEEQAASGSAVVLTAHDRDPIARWCDRTLALRGGGAA